MEMNAFDPKAQARYRLISANGMNVVSETINPEKLIYRIEYATSEDLTGFAKANGFKRTLTSVEHHYWSDRADLKKTILTYSDGFCSYREFSEDGRLITEDTLQRHVEFEYAGKELCVVRVTRPTHNLFVFGVDKKYTPEEMAVLNDVIRSCPWGKNFHHFNPFVKDGTVECNTSGMSIVATLYDQAMIPTEFSFQ